MGVSGNHCIPSVFNPAEAIALSTIWEDGAASMVSVSVDHILPHASASFGVISAKVLKSSEVK
jgi:hypothetical protein